MGNLRIEKENGKFYIYDTLESGNCVCLDVFEKKVFAEKRLAELVEIEKKMAA